MTSKRDDAGEAPPPSNEVLQPIQSFCCGAAGATGACGTIVIPRIYLIDPNCVGDAFSVLKAFCPELLVQAVLTF